MELVLNKCFGGFALSDDAAAILGEDNRYHCCRTNSKLISLIKQKGSEFVSDSDYSELVVVEIPSHATDYVLNDYDGVETVFYVVDGKIHRI